MAGGRRLPAQRGRECVRREAQPRLEFRTIASCASDGCHPPVNAHEEDALTVKATTDPPRPEEVIEPAMHLCHQAAARHERRPRSCTLRDRLSASRDPIRFDLYANGPSRLPSRPHAIGAIGHRLSMLPHAESRGSLALPDEILGTGWPGGGAMTGPAPEGSPGPGGGAPGQRQPCPPGVRAPPGRTQPAGRAGRARSTCIRHRCRCR
jgi:hypothetical protein